MNIASKAPRVIPLLFSFFFFSFLRKRKGRNPKRKEKKEKKKKNTTEGKKRESKTFVGKKCVHVQLFESTGNSCHFTDAEFKNKNFSY